MLLAKVLSAGLCRFDLRDGTDPRRRRISMGFSEQTDGADRNRAQTELLAAMARGEKTALASLYDQLSGPLYSLAHRMLSDPTEAQDLLQDIFLQAWRTASSYDATRGTVFSWLATLVRNRAID